jgi:hypothetical protein
MSSTSGKHNEASGTLWTELMVICYGEKVQKKN